MTFLRQQSLPSLPNNKAVNIGVGITRALGKVIIFVFKVILFIAKYTGKAFLFVLKIPFFLIKEVLKFSLKLVMMLVWGLFAIVGIPIIMSLVYPLIYERAINDALPPGVENSSYYDKVKHGISQFNPKHYLPERTREWLNPFDRPIEEYPVQLQQAEHIQASTTNSDLPESWGIWIEDESKHDPSNFDESNIREVAVVTFPLKGVSEQQDRAKQLGPKGPDGCHTLPQDTAMYAELEITNIHRSGQQLVVTVNHPWLGTSERCRSRAIWLKDISVLDTSFDPDEARAALATKGLSVEDDDLIRVDPFILLVDVIQSYIDYCKDIPECWLCVRTYGYDSNGHIKGMIYAMTPPGEPLMEDISVNLVGRGLAFSLFHAEYQEFAINENRGYWPLIKSGVVPSPF